jgi:hypothetical protein
MAAHHRGAVSMHSIITNGGGVMKYMISQWRAPENFKIELFVVRVGEWGGHMLVECDDPVTVHKTCSTFPAFEFQARPVIPVDDAVRVELEAIAWREGLQRR